MVTNDAGSIMEVVQRHVDRNQPSDYRLVVADDPALTRQEEDWWYVVVRPDRSGVRSHEYAERLSIIEEEILAEEKVHVLLIPTLAHS